MRAGGVGLGVLLATFAAGAQSVVSVTDVGGGNALSTVSQRHLVRIAPPGRAATLLMAVQRDTASSPDPEGLHWYRSDDEGKSWSHYAKILDDGVSGRELHMAADAITVGNDVAIVLSYDTTETNFTADSYDPDRKVYFQWWRYDGAGQWTPGTRLTVSAPPSGSGYHRATLARDSQGRLWVHAWLRGSCPSSAGVNCTDTLRVWVSTDGGQSFTAEPSIFTSPLLGGGRVLSLGTRLMEIWGDYSWDNPARYAWRDDSEPLDVWHGPIDAFSDGDSIYHGAALNAVADGTGGMHLVYKDRYENLYYRHFDGSKFGARTWVDGITSTSDWALQPAITLHRGELYVCTNHPIVAGKQEELRSYRLSDGFTTYEVMDSSATFKGYPSSPAELPPDATQVPCGFAANTGPSKLRVGLRAVTGVAVSPDFGVSVSPSSVTNSGSATVTVTPTGGFAGAVALSVTGAPAGSNVSVSPSSVTIGPGAGSASLTLDRGTAGDGTYALSISGSSGGTKHTATLTWTISTTPPPPSPSPDGGGTPKLETLVDPFAGPSLDSSLWTVGTLSGGGVLTVGNGVLSIGPVANNGSSGTFVTSVGHFALRDSHVLIHAQSVVNAAQNDSARMRVHAPPPNLWNDDVGFWFERGTLYLFMTRAGAETDVAAVTFSPTEHAWWRISETSGQVSWDASPDGTNWTSLASVPTSSVSIPIDDVQLSLESRAFGTSGAASPGTFKVTSLNAAPSGGSDAGIGGASDAGIGGASDAGIGGASDAGVGGASDAGVGGASDAGVGGASDAGVGGASDAGVGGASDAGIGASDAGVGDPNDAGIGGPSDAGIGGPSDAGIGGPSDAGIGGASDAGVSASDAGTGGASDAGIGGASDAGVGGASDAGVGGASDAGVGGASDAGVGGASDAGVGGASDAGVGGASDAGVGASDAGIGGASDAGVGGASDAGAGGGTDAGLGGSDGGLGGATDAGVTDAGTDAGVSVVPTLALTDPFTGPSVDTSKWTVVRDTSGSTATESSGKLKLTLQASSGSSGVHVTSNSAFNFTSVETHVKVSTVNTSTANASTRFTLTPSTNSWTSTAGFWFEKGKLYLYYDSPTASEDVAVLTYSATQHLWWRIRETGGTLFWETSADGATWVTRASKPASAIGFSLSQVHVRMEVKAWSPGSASPGAATFEKLDTQ